MIAQFQEYLDLSQTLIWHGFFVFLRIGAAVSLLPAFGEMSVPVRIKLGVAIAFTFIVAPSVTLTGVEGLDRIGLVSTILVETLIGLVLGLGVRMFVFILQTAGAIAAQSTSLSQLLGNSGAEPLPAIGHVLVVAGFALAVTTGLHIRVATYFASSYKIFAFGVLPATEIALFWGLSQVSQAFGMAFRLAAPFVIMSALYNLTLGVINRAMPQLMVAFVGAPVITTGGLVLLALMSPILLSVWVNALHSFLTDAGVAP
ncbi:flagellar biosynthetic protein FliR [Shimia sp.]|uniref:flagellar biosynthetic protein FliR n=1 Tax=Shimia sp. TaxID=1954381 RepID=UPI00329A68A2